MRRVFPRCGLVIRPRGSLPLALILPLLTCSAWFAQAAAPAPTTPTDPESVVVGDPLAAGKIDLLEQEMIAGLKQRHADGDFMRFRSYLASKLDSTARAWTGSELTGNCRLRWYDRLLRNPLKAPAEAERFTRQLHQAVMVERGAVARVLAVAREKLDLPAREVPAPKNVTTPEQALDAVQEALTGAQVNMAAFFASLSKNELRELLGSLYSVLTATCNVGHTLNDRTTGRRLCDLLEKSDRGSLLAAGECLAPLADRALLAQLAKLPDAAPKRAIQVPGATGTIVRTIDTPAGLIVIGGRGANTYRLDEMADVAAVIDLGGDDTYIEGTTSVHRPVLVTLDLDGNDTYRGSKPGIQGGGLLGASMLVDVAGNDVYSARDVAQGSCLGGVGILVDYAGHDRYDGLRRVQGSALAGVAVLVDRDGDDTYHAAMWAQGYGGPLGFGLLDDIRGDDQYYAGGYWRDSYPETPGYEGWSQGVGSGLRQVACGGFGIILDGAGDDRYEFDYISHGGGYWCGVGFARDFGGNDQHLGSTEKAYSGGPRGESPFQRFGCGFGCHYTLGFLFDDSGNDVYRGSIMGLGHGWDCSIGVLCDFGGNDRYEANSMTVQGTGAQASLGILYDYDGDDVYVGYGQGYASPSISYHSLPNCGGNFSFLVDYGGEDQYGCGARNNSYSQRGSHTGFLIDRPNQKEQQAMTKAETEPPAQQTAAGR